MRKAWGRKEACHTGNGHKDAESDKSDTVLLDAKVEEEAENGVGGKQRQRESGGFESEEASHSEFIDAEWKKTKRRG